MSIIQRLCSTASGVWRRGGAPQHLREENDEETGEEEEENGSGCRQRLICVPGDRVCLCLWAALLSGGGVGTVEARGGVSGGQRSRRRVKGGKVSPGSLCRSPVPAGCSCSSSSLSAGCTAAHLCLRQSGHVDMWTHYSNGDLT